VIVDKRVFVDGTKDVTTDNVIADREGCRVKVPLEFSIQGLGVDTTCRRYVLAMAKRIAR
jgi:hypothetical protein